MCPDCMKEKMQFETEKEAKTFIKFNGSKISDDTEKLRTYYCPSCCCYHISSKPFKNSYKDRTEKLITSYYADIKTEEKKTIISEIQKLFLFDTNIIIKRTGTKKIIKFGLINDFLYGFDETGLSFNLYTLQIDELTSMLKKIKEKTR